MTHPDVAKQHMGTNFFGPKQLGLLGFSERYTKPFREERIAFTPRDFEEWGGDGHGLFSIPSTSLNECRKVLGSRYKLMGRYWDYTPRSALVRMRRKWLMLDLEPYQPASRQPFKEQMSALPHDSAIPGAVEVVVALALYRDRHQKWPDKLQGKVIRTSTEVDDDSVVGRGATLLVVVDKSDPALRLEPWRTVYTGNSEIVLAHIR